MSDLETLNEPFGRYVLEKKLGRGGMAEVFLAYHQDRAVYSEPLVIKRVLSHLKENRTFLEMFLREARMVASFSHPNIVRIIDLGKVGDDFFIAMEFVDGLTVDGLGRRTFARHEEVPLALAAQLVADAALGLDHVHRARAADGKSPVIHRDISPDNLMVNTDGVTKILDFGIARPEGEENLTKTGIIKGKIPFMPPEQIESKKLDGRTDLYALGISMYWLLTERRPFDRASPLMTMSAIVEEQAPPPSRFRPELPAGIDDIVLSLLEKDPELRIATGAKLHEALLPFLTLSRAEVAAITQRRMREEEPPRRRTVQIDAPRPVHTRVVPRRDTPGSAVFVARTAVTPVDERVSPNAVTRATFLGVEPAPIAAAASPSAAVDVGAQMPVDGAPVEADGGIPRSGPHAETLRLPSAPIASSEVISLPQRVAVLRAPTVTAFATEGAPRRSSSTWKGAIAGALVFAGAALALFVSWPRSSEAPLTVVGLTAPKPNPTPPNPVPGDVNAGARGSPVETARGAIDAGPRPRDAAVIERADAPDDANENDDETDVEADERGSLDPATPDGHRKTKDKGRRGPTTTTTTSTASSSSSTASPSPSETPPEPAAALRTDAPAPPKPPEEAPKELRKLDVSAPDHVRFLVEGGKRVRPQNGVIALPLSTKTLVAHDTVRDVKTRIPVGDLPIDYAVLPRGQLSIRAVPYAQVYFGKESIGTTPLPALKVVVGTYKIRLVYEDKEIERIVEVRPGDLTRVSENMTK